MVKKRFKSYRQLERPDCGITCVRMIARYYGKRISIKTLRSLAETSKLGVSLKDITDALSEIDMRSASLRISLDEILRMPCPAIIYWRQTHFVVLYKIDHKQSLFHIADPEEGKMKFSTGEFAKHWKGDSEKGIVIVAEPNENFKQRQFQHDKTLHRQPVFGRFALLSFFL